MQTIPKIIHFVFLDTKEPLPEVFDKCIKRTKNLHPGWRIFIHNEEDAHNIILQYLPDLLPIFDGYGHYIQRADIIRVILMYIFGGVYMDMDMYCLKPIDDELLKHQVVIPEERSVSHQRKKLQEQLDHIAIKHLFRLGNYMFGSIPSHPFWLFYLKEILKISSSQITNEGDILETTGPSILTNVYHRYKSRFPEITILRNSDRECLMPFHKEICCHFGNYAAHLHQGTWRWQHNSKGKIFHNTITESDIKKGVMDLNKRIEQATFCNLSLVNTNSDKRNIVTDALSKQLSFSITEKQNVTTNVLMLGLSRINEFSNKGGHLKISLILTEPVDNISLEEVERINRLVSVCFIFFESWKLRLRSRGVEKPIYVLPLFYLPIKRIFSVEKSQQTNRFPIGLYIETPSQSDIKTILDIQASLRATDKTIDLMLFYSRSRPEPLPGSGYDLKMYDLHDKYISTIFNLLCGFICMSPAIDNLAILKTCLYLGIPVATKDNRDIGQKVFSFCKQIESDNIYNEIMDFKKHFHKYDSKSIEAAKYLEDRISLETIASKIILQSINL